jgi:hypothetical protein
VPFLNIDDLGVQRLPHTAAEELLERNNSACCQKTITRTGR